MPRSTTFIVERLLSQRQGANGREYLVRWEGYNSSWDTWEPEDNIFDDELIQEFHGSLGQAPPGKVAKGMCGTFGCTLPDKHPGLHNVPDLGRPKLSLCCLLEFPLLRDVLVAKFFGLVCEVGVALLTETPHKPVSLLHQTV